MANISSYLNANNPLAQGGAIVNGVQPMAPATPTTSAPVLEQTMPVQQPLPKKKPLEQNTSSSNDNPYEWMSNEEKKELSSGAYPGQMADKITSKLAEENEYGGIRAKLANIVLNNKPMQKMVNWSNRLRNLNDKIQDYNRQSAAVQGRNQNSANISKGTDKSAVKEVEAARKRAVSGSTSKTTSDERLKKIFCGNEDIVKLFGKIQSVDFKYKPEAKEVVPDAENLGVDGDEHIGILAQDLEKNPVTKSAVQEIGGIKTVDTKEMTMANSAVLAEVCRRLENIEKKLGVE